MPLSLSLKNTSNSEILKIFQTRLIILSVNDMGKKKKKRLSTECKAETILESVQPLIQG